MEVNETHREKQVQLLREINERTIRLEVQMIQLQEDREGFITRVEFEPVQRLVYGAAAIILIGVVGAILALVVS